MKLKTTDTVFNLGLTEQVVKIVRIHDFDTGESIRDLVAVYSQRVAQKELCGESPLTTSNKAYLRIPSICDGWGLESVAAMCKAASTSGVPTFTIKNGATSMLSTNLTIDQGETDSSTATTPAVVDTNNNTVNTADQIEIACTVAGTGVTYASVELIFKEAA